MHRQAYSVLNKICFVLLTTQLTENRRIVNTVEASVSRFHLIYTRKEY